MRIQNIRSQNNDKHCELHALVKLDTHWVWGDEPFPLWLRYPAACLPALSAENGDAFVAAFLPIAMALGENLEIEARVSPRLLNSIPLIQEIYRTWDPRLAKSTVHVERRLPKELPRNRQNVGLFFSLGVDSSYALLKNFHEAAPETAISQLITVEGFDVYLWETGRFSRMLSSVNEVARHFGKSVLTVTTNLRELTDRVIDWVDLYHGPALAAVVLSLGGLLRRVHISAGQTYSRLFKSGSHPLLDPLWSTEDTEFIHDGLEATRLAKLRRIATAPILLEHLRVCAADDTSGVFNCGRCEKCIRTMLGLEAIGALEQCPTLPMEIGADRVRNLVIKNPAVQEFMAEILSELPMGDLSAALTECLRRNSAAALAQV